MGELNGPFRNQEMLVGWTNINFSSHDRLTIFSLFDRLPRLAREEVCHLAFVARIEVLNDDDGRKFRVDGPEHVYERGQTSGRGANGDQVAPGAIACNSSFASASHNALAAAIVVLKCWLQHAIPGLSGTGEMDRAGLQRRNAASAGLSLLA
jgi:hypothetical protein